MSTFPQESEGIAINYHFNYHFGASIKDLGKKWFAVTLMTEYTADELLCHL